jgi:predicted esterase
LRELCLGEPKRLTARGRVARGRSAVCAAAFSCTLLIACDGPTLWIGDAVPSVATDASAPVTPPERFDASVGPPLPPVVDPSVPPPPATTSGVATRAQTPTGAPREPDSEDAGVEPGPRTRPMEPPILRPIDLPRAQTACPAMTGHATYRFGDPVGRNLNVEVYVAPDAKTKPDPGGPLILYWHAVGDDSTEVVSGFGRAAIDKVVAQGGVVAAFNTKLCVNCGLADDAVWYDQDDPVADHVVACAIQQAKIDVRRIHSVGFSAGALHSLHLALARSNYIASVVSYSGGMLDDKDAVDPNNKVPAILAFGRQGSDTIVLDFTDLSLSWYETNRIRGYYSMLCQHDGPHVIPEDLVPHVLEFLLDHPYRVAPEPYANMIPSDYPAYCSNTPLN